jgi:Ca-activated chloride channel family protein
MRRRSHGALGAAALAMGVAWLGARALPEAQPAQVYRSGIDLVTLTATVADSTGRLVSGLQMADFEVTENGERQTVTQFTNERVPVSLGILLDISGSMSGRRIQNARLALERFVDDLLDPRDETFVAAFDHRLRVIVPWTSQARGLSHRLDYVHPVGGTAIYDALLGAIPVVDTGSHAKRALVLVTDGADTASDHGVRDVRGQLRRTNAIVYAIGIDVPQIGARADRVNPEVLRELTSESGGGAEVIRDSEDLRAATARIAEELNRQYLIGYTPTRRPDDTYRSIRVQTTDTRYQVRTRRGYYAVSPSR